MRKVKICYFCKRIISCYPTLCAYSDDCRYCAKECHFRNKHYFDFQNVEVKFSGTCNACFENLLRDVD